MNLTEYNKNCIYYSRPRLIQSKEEMNDWLLFLQAEQDFGTCLFVFAYTRNNNEELRDIMQIPQKIKLPFIIVHNFSQINNSTTVEIMHDDMINSGALDD